MAQLHHLSQECTKPELDLFSHPFTQMSIEDATYVEIAPLAAISETGPLEFFLPSDSQKYTDLNNVLLYLRLNITKQDGTALGAEDNVGLINYPLNTIFSQCDVTLGDRLISQSSATHPYRALLECLLSYSKASLQSQFTAGLFYLDTAGKMQAITADGENKGLQKRMAVSARSREFELLGPLHADLFFCDRLLLNGVDLRVKLIRAKNEFCLMGAHDATFKLNILGASLFVKKVEVSPAVRLGHSAALLKANAIYPLTRTMIKSFTLAQGSRVCNQENLFLGNLPKTLVLALVNQTNFSGAYNGNPFFFEHANCEYLALSLDGRQIPAKPFTPRFDSSFYLREYYNLFLATGRHLKDSSLAIGREDFGNGYTLFCFNLSCDDENDGVLSPKASGSLRLEMRFRQALPTTYTLLAYATFDTILEINSRRQVLMDY